MPEIGSTERGNGSATRSRRPEFDHMLNRTFDSGPLGQMPIARDNLDALTGLCFVAALTIALGHCYQPWLAFVIYRTIEVPSKPWLRQLLEPRRLEVGLLGGRG